VTYTYNAQNRLVKGSSSDGSYSEYTYNAMGARVQNVQYRENVNAGYENVELNNGSENITDYTPALDDERATWESTWETEVGTVIQTEWETVTVNYTVDYLSVANRDIMVETVGAFVTRYVYDPDGTRISAEFSYADGTERGDANEEGEYGENIASDVAVLDLGKVWFRGNLVGSSLYAVDSDGETVVHAIYDPWGNPVTETAVDLNFTAIVNLNNYTGYTWDETLGLFFAQYRFYDAENHRFTQQDAAKDGGNWYVYCANNPVTNVDPSGLKTKGQVIAYGSGGYDVEQIQQFLRTNGYLGKDGKPITVDGDFGINTQFAVKTFQKRRGLTVDGLVGDKTWQAMGFPISGPDVFGGKRSSAYTTLLDSLSKSVNNYKTFWQTVGTALYNSDKEALDTVLSYDAVISQSAQEFKIDKAMIQAILFQEIRFFNLLDAVDGIVIATYNYKFRCEEYSNMPWYEKMTVIPPIPPIYQREDSSTGLGQIFASTAIDALNWQAKYTKYDKSNWKTVWDIWSKLHYDNEYNVYMVGLVLAHKKYLIQNNNPQLIMQRYNGTGDLAKKYGIVTQEYYNAFKKYNSSI
jgi:RHS repeat-associated protein